MTLDYEGDDNYLSFEVLVDLCEWITKNHPQKRFYYTICVRSELYDINTYSDEQIDHKKMFLRSLLSLYRGYDVLQIILVAGNKKYLSASARGQTYGNRMEMFIHTLLGHNLEKYIFLGVDNIFKTGKRLLEKFSQTKAIFLLSPAIKDQLAKFEKFDNRICIYALQIDSVQLVNQNAFIRSYLSRRGEAEADFSHIVKNYALIKNTQNTQFGLLGKEKYFWFIFRA